MKAMLAHRCHCGSIVAVARFTDPSSCFKCGAKGHPHDNPPKIGGFSEEELNRLSIPAWTPAMDLA